MTNEELFFQFVKGHDDLAHIEYGETPVEGQEWIGVLDPEETLDNGIHDGKLYIDPNWDEIGDGFLASSGFGDDTMKNKIDALDTAKKASNFVLKYVLTPMKEANVQADKVYVVIGSSWTKTWFDSIEEI
jgi:hypothetical protein